MFVCLFVYLFICLVHRHILSWFMGKLNTLHFFCLRGYYVTMLEVDLIGSIYSWSKNDYFLVFQRNVYSIPEI